MKTLIIKSKKHGRFKALLDDEDYVRAKDINWMIFCGKTRRTQYAQRWVEKIKGRDRYEWMHHWVLGRRAGKVIDHIDGNGLNNQKANLRFCTQRQNILNQRTRVNNKSGFKGVHFCNREQKWVAAIAVNGKKKFLGYFKTAHDGHMAWKKKAMELRGEFYQEQ